MSRKVYTYTDLTKINTCKGFLDLMRYPQITVSSDLRKCLNGRADIDMVDGLFVDDTNFRVTEFSTFAKAIDEEWDSDKSKFTQMVLLSEFMRKKLDEANEDERLRNWLMGCMRNIDSMLSAISLLEQAEVKPEDIKPMGDRNLELFVEVWGNLIEKDSAIAEFRAAMEELKNRSAWESVFRKAFNLEFIDKIDTVVFHGFYYITPYQERIMNLLEEAGFNLIYLIQYDERYPYVYEIWDETYSEERGYDPKENWHIEKSESEDAYGSIFEGRTENISNKLEIKEYASIMEFVDDVKHIRENEFSLYSANFKLANRVLMEYFPEAFGERKILSYPVGQFIGTLNSMWDEDTKTISVDEDKLIECFSSGWLSFNGVSARHYMQDLMYVIPFFNGCRTVEEWEERIKLFREVREYVIAPFEVDLDSDTAVSRWQEAIGSPLKNFSMFAVSSEKPDIILKLIEKLLDMARELFGKNEVVHIHDHIRNLDSILKKYGVSHELYEEERDLVKDIFEKLSADNSFDTLCHPCDIARALELFISGKYEEGEIRANKVGLVYPLHFIDAACVKNKSRVHICLSDVESLPGVNKDYIWPLTDKKMREVYASTKNKYVRNLISIMESTILCNRYFTYSALKNKEVTISWISMMGEKPLAPSPYIKILMKATGKDLIPAARDRITFKHVTESPKGQGKIREYDKDKAPTDMIKEARMDYALCPMKYVFGYVLEKFPSYQSDFQMNYALNALISAIYNLMKDGGISIDEAYEAVIVLFPNLRKVEKRQFYDYISYNRRESDMDYANRTRCGGRLYTDERLKIHYPNPDVRSRALFEYDKLGTDDGQKGLNIYEATDVPEACTFCQHIGYCRNALYSGDQENYYD